MHHKLNFIAYMCNNYHTLIAFISINIYIFYWIFGSIILIFVFIFANMSLNNCVCNHICPFLVNPNIFLFVFI